MPLHTPRSILLVRPSALGDVCRTVPLAASLRCAFPQAAIDWLVQDTFAEAVEAHPDVRTVVPFPRRRLGQLMKTGRIDRVLKWSRSLRTPGYDLAIDAQGLFRSAWLTYSSRAPRRIGFANAAEGAAIFYNERHRVDRSMHTVDRMLALLERAGIEPVPNMRLYTTPDAQRHAAAVCPPKPIVIAPTSRWPSKRWPIDRFRTLVDELLNATDAHIVVVGGPGEQDQCAPLLELAHQSNRVVDLVGKTSVGQLMGVIERARLVVANDSAALHMAVGFNRPIVALFGPTDVARVGPYRRESDVIQHRLPGEPINHKNDAQAALMRRIGVEEVLNACLVRLNERNAGACPGAPLNPSRPHRR